MKNIEFIEINSDEYAKLSRDDTITFLQVIHDFLNNGVFDKSCPEKFKRIVRISFEPKTEQKPKYNRTVYKMENKND